MIELKDKDIFLQKAIPLVDFPSEIDTDDNVKIYDDMSVETRMAVLSHYLHNPNIHLEASEKFILLDAIN